MSLIGKVFYWFYEWAAKGKDYADLLEKFEQNQTVVTARMEDAKEMAFNRIRAAHVIGIERWGAHRLRVLLGEPLVMDEYDGYAPSEELSMRELAEEFKQTRTATLALIHELQSNGIDLSQTVKHNEVGDLSARGWLFYLENHMGRETTLLVRGQKNSADNVSFDSGNK